jgi:hypothetical protein
MWMNFGTVCNVQFDAKALAVPEVLTEGMAD